MFSRKNRSAVPAALHAGRSQRRLFSSLRMRAPAKKAAAQVPYV